MKISLIFIQSLFSLNFKRFPIFPWHDAGLLTTCLFLSALPLFFGSGNAYAEQAMDAAAVKPETSSEHKKSMKVPNISFTTVQLADTVTQDAVRSGK